MVITSAKGGVDHHQPLHVVAHVQHFCRTLLPEVGDAHGKTAVLFQYVSDGVLQPDQAASWLADCKQAFKLFGVRVSDCLVFDRQRAHSVALRETYQFG